MRGIWRTGALALAVWLLGCAHRPSAAPAGAPGAGGQAPPGGAAGDSLHGPYGALYRTRAELPRLSRLAGHREAPDSRLDWTAWSERDSLRFIREDLEVPLSGKHVNEYAFEHGVLAVFASSGEHALTGGPDERGPYRMRIAYDAAGKVVAAEKFVSDAGKALEPYEAPAALSRADWLRALIRQDSTAAR
jgi:hypothetical protein